MRARAPFALSLFLLSALAAYACGNGTFPSALPQYDPDAGQPLGYDSAAPAQDTGSPDGSAEGSAEGGDAASDGDSGDASVVDGDSEAPTDASDAG